ncbi:hypothetical protein CYMTET_24940 [Cymbomonas tetramitiformis]|uniref:Uncharacterized protein n=1 Tax=Cymbomonas tetramitiformis TaxID=36881 RepID=A0AAE0KZP3_9CHLO|nr:hypothetical protein CYMTET_24940 [Cymbomonas tetramitiformis]
MTLQSFMSAPNYNGSRVAAAAIRQLQDQLAACEAQLAHATSQNMVLQEECYRLSLVPAREEQETNNRLDHELREDMTQMSSNISEVKKALQDTVQQAAAAENKAQDLQTESQRLKEENRSLMLQLRRYKAEANDRQTAVSAFEEAVLEERRRGEEAVAQQREVSAKDAAAADVERQRLLEELMQERAKLPREQERLQGDASASLAKAMALESSLQGTVQEMEAWRRDAEEAHKETRQMKEACAFEAARADAAIAQMETAAREHSRQLGARDSELKERLAIGAASLEREQQRRAAAEEEVKKLFQQVGEGEAERARLEREVAHMRDTTLDVESRTRQEAAVLEAAQREMDQLQAAKAAETEKAVSLQGELEELRRLLERERTKRKEVKASAAKHKAALQKLMKVNASLVEHCSMRFEKDSELEAAQDTKVDAETALGPDAFHHPNRAPASAWLPPQPSTHAATSAPYAPPPPAPAFHGSNTAPFSNWGAGQNSSAPLNTAPPFDILAPSEAHAPPWSLQGATSEAHAPPWSLQGATSEAHAPPWLPQGATQQQQAPALNSIQHRTAIHGQAQDHAAIHGQAQHHAAIHGQAQHHAAPPEALQRAPPPLHGCAAEPPPAPALFHVAVQSSRAPSLGAPAALQQLFPASMPVLMAHPAAAAAPHQPPPPPGPIAAVHQVAVTLHEPSPAPPPISSAPSEAAAAALHEPPPTMAPMPTAHSAAAALQEPLPAPASISTAHPAGAATTLHQPPPAQVPVTTTAPTAEGRPTSAAPVFQPLPTLPKARSPNAKDGDGGGQSEAAGSNPLAPLKPNSIAAPAARGLHHQVLEDLEKEGLPRPTDWPERGAAILVASDAVGAESDKAASKVKGKRREAKAPSRAKMEARQQGTASGTRAASADAACRLQARAGISARQHRSCLCMPRGTSQCSACLRSRALSHRAGVGCGDARPARGARAMDSKVKKHDGVSEEAAHKSASATLSIGADVALEVLSQHQIREVLASLEAELCQMDSEYNTILRQKQQDVMTEENKENLSTREARVVDAINAKGMQVQRLRFYLINHRQQ